MCLRYASEEGKIARCTWASLKISMHEAAELGDEDLLDLAARQTFLHGGSVYAMEREKMPEKRLPTAIYQY